MVWRASMRTIGFRSGPAAVGSCQDLPLANLKTVAAGACRSCFSDSAGPRAGVVDEHSYTEIAMALRCSEMVARKRVSRGLARMRARLQERP